MSLIESIPEVVIFHSLMKFVNVVSSVQYDLYGVHCQPWEDTEIETNLARE